MALFHEEKFAREKFQNFLPRFEQSWLKIDMFLLEN